MLDYYAILGVRRDADANAIRAAYRELARTHHPDRNDDAAAHERFKAANEAYRVLSDPAARARYDRFGLRPDGSVYGAVAVPVAPSGFADLARAVARGVRRAVRPRGADITIDVRLTPFEMIQGSRRVFSLPRRRRDQSIEMRRIEFVLPALLRPGQRLSWKGEGAPSDDLDLPPGQLIVHIVAAPMDGIDLDGADLIATLPLRPSEAVAGVVRSVRTAEGDESLRIPPLTQHGTRLTLAGRGLARAGGGRGAFHHVVRVEWPPDPPEFVLSALRAWESGSGGSAQ